MKPLEEKDIEGLGRVFRTIDDEVIWCEFLKDLLSPGEIRAIADRWKVAQELNKGKTYRTINKELGVSTATITRVARGLTRRDSGYRQVLGRLSNEKEQ